MMNGYLGDQCSALPTINWVLNDQLSPDNVIVAVKSNMKFLYHFVPKHCLIDINDLMSLGIHANLLQQFSEGQSYMKSHPCDVYGFQWFGKVVPNQWRSIPKAPLEKISKNLLGKLNGNGVSPSVLKNCAVIPMGSRTESKSWNMDTLEKIVNHLLSKKIKPLFIGYDDKESISDYRVGEKNLSFIGKNQIEKQKVQDILKMGLDLTNQTTLRDCLYLFQKCKMLIGMEGGLAHLASLTDIPMIIGYTLVNPAQRMPWRHGELGWKIKPLHVSEGDELGEKQNSGCRFCMTDWFLADWNWDQCYRYHYVDSREKHTCKMIPITKWQGAIDELCQ
jgi:hypothetical protein